MHAAFRDGFRSPGGIASEIGLAGCVLLWLAWWLGRDSGVGIFGGLISIFGLAVTAFTGKLVWELQSRHLRHVVIRQSFERLGILVDDVRVGLADRDFERARRALGAIFGTLERLSRHATVMDDAGVLLADLRTALAADRRSLQRKVQTLLPPIDRCIEILRTMLLELESGGPDD